MTLRSYPSGVLKRRMCSKPRKSITDLSNDLIRYNLLWINKVCLRATSAASQFFEIAELALLGRYKVGTRS